MLIALTKFDYTMILAFHDTFRASTSYCYVRELDVHQFLQNVFSFSRPGFVDAKMFSQIPKDFRRKIIRPQPFHSLSKPKDAQWTRPHILGYGKKKVLCWKSKEGGSYLQSCPSESRLLLIVKFIKTQIAVGVKT